jgi:DNA polymerase III alpha subunit
MPDIDIDFCFEKRDRVIEYIIEKYGADRVAPNHYFWNHGRPGRYP